MGTDTRYQQKNVLTHFVYEAQGCHAIVCLGTCTKAPQILTFIHLCWEIAQENLKPWGLRRNRPAILSGPPTPGHFRRKSGTEAAFQELAVAFKDLANAFQDLRAAFQHLAVALQDLAVERTVLFCLVVTFQNLAVTFPDLAVTFQNMAVTFQNLAVAKTAGKHQIMELAVALQNLAVTFQNLAVAFRIWRLRSESGLHFFRMAVTVQNLAVALQDLAVTSNTSKHFPEPGVCK